MRDIFLGLRDYVKDTWHDVYHRQGFYEFKEGSLAHYIRQRRLARKNKKTK